MAEPAKLLPVPLRPPSILDGVAPTCVVLVDGEHYPSAVADAIALLQAAGWAVAGAALVGGGEKLRGEPDYGVPHVAAPEDDPGPAGALRAALATAGDRVSHVLDLADEPVLVFERRLELITAAASRGLHYANADTAISPPTCERIDRPTLAIIGTGKRIGKTAVSAHAARVIDAHLAADDDVCFGEAVVVVAMGRGGPAEPIVIDRSEGEMTIERLLEISRGGAHAASDYLEGAALTGLTTVGCRRVSGGLLGVPAASNVPAGARLAAAIDPTPALVLLEGSGSCVPPVHADRSLLLATSERPQDLVEGLGLYRLGLADLVVVMGDDEVAGEHLAARARVLAPEVLVIAASLVPTPVGEVDGRRVAAFTTAPAHVAPAVRHELEARGAEVVLVSCNLARREELAADLDRAIADEVDTFVVEIKAAAIDSVAEAADAAGIEVVFLDNVPRAHDESVDLDAELRALADAAIAARATRG